jgi:hypothetical protein
MERHLRVLLVFLFVSFFFPQLGFAAHSFLATVTAYTSLADALTASGAPPSDGVMACPRKYAFGTRFTIAGKIYECRDRLSRKYKDRFDIWTRDKTTARQFGKRILPLVPVPVRNRSILMAAWFHGVRIRF